MIIQSGYLEETIRQPNNNIEKTPEEVEWGEYVDKKIQAIEQYMSNHPEEELFLCNVIPDKIKKEIQDKNFSSFFYYGRCHHSITILARMNDPITYNEDEIVLDTTEIPENFNEKEQEIIELFSFYDPNLFSRYLNIINEYGEKFKNFIQNTDFEKRFFKQVREETPKAIEDFKKGEIFYLIKIFNVLENDLAINNEDLYNKDHWDIYFENYQQIKNFFQVINIHDQFLKEGKEKAINFLNDGDIGCCSAILEKLELKLNEEELSKNKKHLASFFFIQEIKPYLNLSDHSDFEIEKMNVPIKIKPGKARIPFCPGFENSLINEFGLVNYGVCQFNYKEKNIYFLVRFYVLEKDGGKIYFIPLKNYQIGNEILYRNEAYAPTNKWQNKTQSTKNEWGEVLQNEIADPIKNLSKNLKNEYYLLNNILELELPNEMTLQLIGRIRPEKNKDTLEPNNILPALRKVLFTKDIKKLLEGNKKNKQ